MIIDWKRWNTTLLKTERLQVAPTQIVNTRKLAAAVGRRLHRTAGVG
jgi:hypothetical protein